MPVPRVPRTCDRRKAFPRSTVPSARLVTTSRAQPLITFWGRGRCAQALAAVGPLPAGHESPMHDDDLIQFCARRITEGQRQLADHLRRRTYQVAPALCE